ncbi:hypothetical protein CLOM_g14448 [Closterium sp. NIES-68]|nr:hypothetical protein CLOM_g14448 [Closterium sp. NIES-68]
MDKLDYLLEKGFVRPSTSPFAAPILFTPKKDGGLRMCIDYRALNQVTINSRYPIPRADELIDQLRGAKFFSKIDMRGGYHRIRVNGADYYKTAFRTRYGRYEYKLDKCVIVYLNDILVHSTTQEQHLKDLTAVFSLLQQHRLITKGSKCEFLKHELEFFGHVISIDGVKIDPKKIATIQDWKPPTNLRELQGFLGFVNYVRHFIPNMAGVTSPLTDLLKKGTSFEWGGEQQAAFEQLKLFLTTPSVLRIADPHRPFELITDASDLAVGALLLQDFGEGLQPIAYESRKLKLAEQNYPVHDKELLAIAHAFKVWCCCLTGADVTVRIDHKAYYLKSGTNRIWVPTYRTLRELLIQEAHESNFWGHYGIDKTAKLLSRNYYKPELPTDVQLYVTSCATCQCMKPSRLRHAGSLQPLEPPNRPWQQVTKDFVTGVPAGPSGNDAILVVVDRLTKMAHFAACKTTITAEQTAKLFLTAFPRQSSAIVTHGSRPTSGQKPGNSTAHVCICPWRTTRNRMAD